MSSSQPNFVCFVTDQQRADHLGCAGNGVVQTPNLDRLAQSGVRFTRAYVNNPLCMPSRSTMWTGRTARGHGVRTNGIPLNPRIPTMTQALADSGYRTHGIGKFHLNCFGTPKGVPPETLKPEHFPESRAMWTGGRISSLPQPYYGMQTTEFVGGHGSGVFGDYLNWLNAEHPGRSELLQPKAGRPPTTGAEQSWKMALPDELHHSKWIADRAIAFLEEQARKDQPFFLWVSFPDPHHPYCPPAPWSDMYAPADIPLPNRREGELEDLAPHYRRVFGEGLPLSGRFAATKMPDECLREIIALTYGMISLMDHHLGRVLDKLDRLGLRENTCVSFFSDHGDMMGDHWIVNKGPFHFDGLVHVPFIWSWPGHFPGGREVPALGGILDFAPTVLDLAGVPIPEGDVPAEPECPRMPPPWPGVSLAPVLRGETSSVQDAIVVENDEDYLGLRLRTLVTDRYKLTVYPGQDYGELFDRENDPQELHNLWSDPAAQTVKQELQVRLLEELVLTNNPLPRRLCHA